MHPMAWWAWALGAAVAVSMTHNPLLLVLLLASVWLVVLTRRTRAPWAKALRGYLLLALLVVGIRMFFQIVMGVSRTGTVLFTLPEVRLPEWAAGIRLGGPVTAEGLLFTLYDSLRLGGMLLCIGAANTLANPKRALKSIPPALYQISVAVVIALSVAPQLVESVQRVRRARRLRGGASTGWRAVRAVIIPVMEDSIDRSLLLAAGMESRGYGRTHDSRPVGAATTLTLLASALAVLNGTFWMLGMPTDDTDPWLRRHLGVLLLALGVAFAGMGFRLSGRRLAVTRYRPDPWLLPEWLVLAAAVAMVGVSLWLARVMPLAMTPATSPPAWPQLPLPLLLVVAAAASPLFTTPTPGKDEL